MAPPARHRMRTRRFRRRSRMNQIGVRILRVAQIAAADAAVTLAAVERPAGLADASAPDAERIGLHAIVIQRPDGCRNRCHSSSSNNNKFFNSNTLKQQ